MMARYVIAIGLAGLLSPIATAVADAEEPGERSGPVVGRSDKNDTSPPLRDIRPRAPSRAPEVREIPRRGRPTTAPELRATAAQPQALDPVVQRQPAATNMPTTTLSFDGISNVGQLPAVGFQVTPPDTNGDVGPNHYVQTVNLSFAVYDKSGTLLLGPLANNTVWSGFGGPCQNTNDGDPIVLYDHLADRWLFSQFADVFVGPPFYQCVAVSQTGDPTGSWYRYQFSFTDLNDYPKFGVWPDAYYMMANLFDAQGYVGNSIAALERDKMLVGQSAQFVSFVSPVEFTVLPSDLDGPPPPLGAPNYFVGLGYNVSGPIDILQVFEFHVDWANTANSMIVGPTQLATAPYDANMCNFSRDCIPQPGTTQRLDAIADGLMYRLQYRNFGTHQTLVVNHTVDADATDHAGIRWYELRNTSTAWSIYQQGTHAPDGDHRWMGSVAMDSSGNMALGYSVSSGTTNPSIRYAGRLAGDPLDTLPQAETVLIAGSGSQTGSERWGDYSMMAVDPADGCTFWYTQEYYAADSAIDWRTRIGSFRFPSCASGILQGTVSASSNGDPIAGARVDAGPFTTFTDSNGFYQIANVQVSSYDVSVTAFAYRPASLSGVSVVDGGTAVQNLALVGVSAPPTNLMAVDRPNDQGGTIDLAWTVFTSTDVTQQRLYRATTTGAYTSPVQTFSSTTSAFTDTGLSSTTTYFYVVRAFNGTSESPDTNEVSAVPVDDLAPAAPTNLNATDRPDDQGGAIDLAWTVSTSTDVTEQRLYRRTTSTSYSTSVQTFSSTTSSYTDM